MAPNNALKPAKRNCIRKNESFIQFALRGLTRCSTDLLFGDANGIGPVA